jgi:hypothetical protein
VGDDGQREIAAIDGDYTTAAGFRQCFVFELALMGQAVTSFLAVKQLLLAIDT